MPDRPATNTADQGHCYVLQEPVPTISGHLYGLERSNSLLSRAFTESTEIPSSEPSPDLTVTTPGTPEPCPSIDHSPSSNSKSRHIFRTFFGGAEKEVDTHVKVPKAEEAEVVQLKQGSLVTIFAIWNTMMGSSLLIMPWAIAQAGYVLGIGLTIFLGCLSYYTCSLVLKTSEKERDPTDAEKVIKPEFSDFGDAIEYYLGRKLSYFGVVISLLTFLGALIAYWIFMTRFLFNMGNVIYHYTWDTNHTGHDSHSKLEAPLEFDSSNATYTTSYGLFEEYWSADYTVPIYLIAILYPISCMREPTVFTKFNSLGVCSVFILIGYVIYRAAIWGINMDSQVDDSINGFSTNFPAISGSLSMGFFIHNGILPITAHHEKPAKKKRDLGIAYFLVAITYLCIGIIYYITYPEAKKDIPDNFLRLVTKDDIYGIVASVFLLFQMVTVYPLLLFLFRNQFMIKIIRNPNYRYPWIFAINCGAVAICVLLAMFWPRVGALIRIVGAVSGFVYNYTFPCLVYLAALRAAGHLTKISIFVHAVIVVFGVVNLIAQFVIPLD